MAESTPPPSELSIYGYPVLQPGQVPTPGVVYSMGQYSSQLIRANQFGSTEVYSTNQYNPNAQAPVAPGPTGLYVSYDQGKTPVLSASYTAGAEPFVGAYQGTLTTPSGEHVTPAQALNLFSGYTSPNGGSTQSSQNNSNNTSPINPLVATAHPDYGVPSGGYYGMEGQTITDSSGKQLPTAASVLNTTPQSTANITNPVTAGKGGADYTPGTINSLGQFVPTAPAEYTPKTPYMSGGSIEPSANTVSPYKSIDKATQEALQPTNIITSGIVNMARGAITLIPFVGPAASVGLNTVPQTTQILEGKGNLSTVQNMPFYNLYNTTVNTKPTVESALNLYTTASKELAPYTTDIGSAGARLEKAPDFAGSGVVPEVLNEVKGFSSHFVQSPFEVVTVIGSGAIFKAGEYGLSAGIAKAATSELPVLSTIGKLASTPVAADVGTLAKLGLGGLMLVSAGENYLKQPTAEKRGEVLADTAIQIGGFMFGYNALKTPAVENPYYGIGFLSGKPEMSPIESSLFKGKVALASLRTSEPGGYREVGDITLSARMIEPGVKAEPNLGELTVAGEYSNEIKATLLEQQHSIYGSAATRNQYSPEIVSEAKLRLGKDVDTYVQDKTKALQSLAEKMGTTPEGASNILDAHPFENYPGFMNSKITADIAAAEENVRAPRTVTELIYGKIASPRNAGEVIKPGTLGYPGELAYEASSALFGRKAAAVASVIEKPIEFGFRAPKDIYDFITTYQAQRLTAISSGVPKEHFAGSDAQVESLLNRRLTIGTVKHQTPGDNGETFTGTIRDIMNSLNVETTGKEPMPFGGKYAEVPEVKPSFSTRLLSATSPTILSSSGIIEPSGNGGVSTRGPSSVSDNFGSTTPSVSSIRLSSLSVVPVAPDVSSLIGSTSTSNTPSVSKSMSMSVSVSGTQSGSVTPSLSISPSVLSSGSLLNSVSPSASPSVSNIPSVSPSLSNSPSVSTSPSASPSLSNSPSISTSNSGSPSRSILPSVIGSSSIIPPYKQSDIWQELKPKTKKFKPHTQVFEYPWQPAAASRLQQKILGINTGTSKPKKKTVKATTTIKPANINIAIPKMTMATPKPVKKTTKPVMKAPRIAGVNLSTNIKPVNIKPAKIKPAESLISFGGIYGKKKKRGKK